MEVDQEAELFVGQLQMADDLGQVDRVVRSGFELTDNEFFDKHIEFERTLQLDSVIYEREPDLSLESQATLPEFVAEALFVDALQ